MLQHLCQVIGRKVPLSRAQPVAEISPFAAIDRWLRAEALLRDGRLHQHDPVRFVVHEEARGLSQPCHLFIAPKDAPGVDISIAVQVLIFHAAVIARVVDPVARTGQVQPCIDRAEVEPHRSIHVRIFTAEPCQHAAVEARRRISRHPAEVVALHLLRARNGMGIAARIRLHARHGRSCIDPAVALNPFEGRPVVDPLGTQVSVACLVGHQRREAPRLADRPRRKPVVRDLLHQHLSHSDRLGDRVTAGHIHLVIPTQLLVVFLVP